MVYSGGGGSGRGYRERRQVKLPFEEVKSFKDNIVCQIDTDFVYLNSGHTNRTVTVFVFLFAL